MCVGGLLRVVLVCPILGRWNSFILSTIEDHNLIDSHCEVELWNSIVVEAAFGNHARRAITHNSHLLASSKI